jgi:hypothetical protein
MYGGLEAGMTTYRVNGQTTKHHFLQVEFKEASEVTRGFNPPDYVIPGTFKLRLRG